MSDRKTIFFSFLLISFFVVVSFHWHDRYRRPKSKISVWFLLELGGRRSVEKFCFSFVTFWCRKHHALKLCHFITNASVTFSPSFSFPQCVVYSSGAEKPEFMSSIYLSLYRFGAIFSHVTGRALLRKLQRLAVPSDLRESCRARLLRVSLTT